MSSEVISDEPFMKVVGKGDDMPKSYWKDYVRGLKNYLIEISSTTPVEEQEIKKEIDKVEFLLNNHRKILRPNETH